MNTLSLRRFQCRLEAVNKIIENYNNGVWPPCKDVIAECTVCPFVDVSHTKEGFIKKRQQLEELIAALK